MYSQLSNVYEKLDVFIRMMIHMKWGFRVFVTLLLRSLATKIFYFFLYTVVRFKIVVYEPLKCRLWFKTRINITKLLYLEPEDDWIVAWICL